jgi:CubicO group peptidase (beta-lactamase class C family)
VTLQTLDCVLVLVSTLVSHPYSSSNKICTEFFESLKNNNLTWQPGQKAAYSNSGFIILGFVLEKVTSMKFKDIIYEKISKPLGLSSATGFELQDPSRAVLPPDGGFELMSLPLGNYDP